MSKNENPNTTRQRSVLVVVAHPDDEVLGCGGTAASFAKLGIPVRVCILAADATARRNRPEVSQLHHDIEESRKVLGLMPYFLGGFANIKLNSIPHLDLVRFIEQSIDESGANVIFTHHPNDLNNDHLHTSLACQAAARLFQRRQGTPTLRALYFMEILSSTDWAFDSFTLPFMPNTFFGIHDTLDLKIDALMKYKGVMRPYPHSRSPETIRALATLRGSQSGKFFAEAFQCVFNDLSFDLPENVRHTI